MKKMTRYTLLFAAGFLAVQGLAFGEMVRGQVTSVNPNENTITINRTDQPGVERSVRLEVPEDAQLSGIRSLAELQVGDQIQVEAESRFFGPMEVRSLHAGQAGEAPAFGEEGAGMEAGIAGEGAQPQPAEEGMFASPAEEGGEGIFGQEQAGAQGGEVFGGGQQAGTQGGEAFGGGQQAGAQEGQQAGAAF